MAGAQQQADDVDERQPVDVTRLDCFDDQPRHDIVLRLAVLRVISASR